jgi:hypothetical protein
VAADTKASRLFQLLDQLLDATLIEAQQRSTVGTQNVMPMVTAERVAMTFLNTMDALQEVHITQ